MFFGDSEQVVPVNTFIVPNLIVPAYPAGIYHDTALRIGFRVKEIVALRAKVQRGLFVVTR